MDHRSDINEVESSRDIFYDQKSLQRPRSVTETVIVLE
jgi:hypothetical protein